MSLPAATRTFRVSAAEHSFERHWLAYADSSVHYLDEGRSAPALLLHGNPTWSFIYGRVIGELRSDRRLVPLGIRHEAKRTQSVLEAYTRPFPTPAASHAT